MITIDPAIRRVDTRYEIDLMPMTSSASISSLMRMAPSSAVAPAPTVAAMAWPVTTGATTRMLASAAKNPVNASTPMLPSDAKPWMAISEPADRVTKPMMATVPPMTAMRRCHPDLGDQTQGLAAIVLERVRDMPDRVDDEPGDVPDAVQEPARRTREPGGSTERPGKPGPKNCRCTHVVVPNRTPMVVSTTLTANSATTQSTSVSLTAVPTPLEPPATVSPR